MGRAYTESTSPAISPTQHMSRVSSFNPSKPILKKRSHSEVILAGKMAQTNLLTRAAQAVREERRREQEERELREEKRKNPLMPSHVLRQQQRMRRNGSTDVGIINLSPESPFNVVGSTSGCASAQITTNRTDYFGPGNWSNSGNGGQTLSASKRIHFNDRVEQCIAIDVKDDEDFTIIEEESEEEGLYMGSHCSSTVGGNRAPKVEHHSIIAKLPATTLRPGDEPFRETTQVPLIHNPFEVLKPEPSSTFYLDEETAIHSSSTPLMDLAIPEVDEDAIDDFPFENAFESQVARDTTASNTATTTSSRRSSSSNLEEESQRRASVSAIPIPYARDITARNHEGLMGEEDDDERFGIVGLAADAISTAKDLVGVLWNKGWGARR
jgi:hypothetical protein